MLEPPRSTTMVQRFFHFPAIRLVIGFIWIFAVIGVTQSVFLFLPARETVVARLLSMITTVAVAILSYYAYVRILENRPVSELAVSGAVTELVSGILIGSLLFSSIIGTLWLLGYYDVKGINPWTAAVPILVGSVISGVVEEILFRGILFRITQEGLGTWIALLVSAGLFGLLHLANPNATIAAAIAIAIEAGVLLAAAFMLTRRLWMAIGIHFAWNFMQGGVFCVAVSGIQSSGLLRAELAGPELLTGGEFGPEASILAVIVCLTAGCILLWMAIRKGHIVKPFWSR